MDGLIQLTTSASGELTTVVFPPPLPSPMLLNDAKLPGHADVAIALAMSQGITAAPVIVTKPQRTETELEQLNLEALARQYAQRIYEDEAPLYKNIDEPVIWNKLTASTRHICRIKKCIFLASGTGSIARTRLQMHINKVHLAKQEEWKEDRRKNGASAPKNPPSTVIKAAKMSAQMKRRREDLDRNPDDMPSVGDPHKRPRLDLVGRFPIKNSRRGDKWSHHS